MKFAELRLVEPILRAVATEGYTDATPIQEQTIPLVLEGRDVLGSAQTGTGKSAAFALPVLHRLSQSKAPHAPAQNNQAQANNHRGYGARGRNNSGGGRTTSNAPRKLARCLVLCPTRELAKQISESFATYGRNLPITGTVIFGGVNQNPQVRSLNAGVDVIVATPGRLQDLMAQGHVDLNGIQTLILDEADRMLDMGFIHDIRRIVERLPSPRQTLLFSATMPREIRQLAQSLLTNPVTVEITPEKPTVEAVEQFVYHVSKKNKPALLAHLLHTTSVSRALVFTRTKFGADRVVKQLRAGDVQAEAIHGNKTQNARERALKNFTVGKTHVLVATDIAARGLDVEGISHVINFDLTHEPETYIHRIGRTARAGASGMAISFCDHDERGHLTAIQRLIGKTIEIKTDAPTHLAAEAIPSDPPTPRQNGDGHIRPRYAGKRPSGGRPGGRPEGRSGGHTGGSHAKPRYGNPTTPAPQGRNQPRRGGKKFDKHR